MKDEYYQHEYFPASQNSMLSAAPLSNRNFSTASRTSFKAVGPLGDAVDLKSLRDSL